MPIDFKQVAAPSFSDSNTLVALAAKQQQEAMTGIQGAWTGAMDAVQNNVQGELKNRLNMAGYDDLTDPTKRAALNADMLAFNEKNLGMADMNAMGAYADGRIPITMANQTGKLAFNEATKAADRLDTQTHKDTKEAAEKSYLDDSVRYGSWLLDSIEQYGTEKTNPNFNPDVLAELNNRYSSLTEEINNHPNAESMLPKFHYGLEDFNNERTLANQKVNQGNLRTDGMSITNDNAVEGMNIKQTRLAMDLADRNPEAKNTQAKYSKVFADYPGLVNPDGVSLDFNAGRTLLNGEIAKVKDRSNDRLTDAGTFDEFLVTNKKSLDDMGNLGMFSNTSHESIMKHFEVAASKGVPYSDKEKMEAYRAIATGSIKIDMLPDFASGDAGELKVRKAMKNNFVRDSVSKRQDAINTGTREAINGVIDRYRAAGVPLDVLVGKDGLNLVANPELEQYLPSDITEAMGIISKTNSDAYMNGTMGGIGGGLPRNDYAAKNAPQIDTDIAKLVGKGSPGSGVLANKTTEDLAAIGKANNVGDSSKKATSNTAPESGTAAHNLAAATSVAENNKKKAVTPKATNYKSNNGYTYSSKTKYVTDNNSGMKMETVPVTAEMVKRLGVQTNSKGDIVLPSNRVGELVTTVYGTQFKLSDAASYKIYISIQNSPQATDKIVKGNAFINGTSSYKAPSRRLSTPDLKHPLANLLSDDPKNFVPYNERNADGSPKHISKVKKKKYGKFTYKDAYTKY